MSKEKIKSDHIYPTGNVWVALDKTGTKVLACVATFKATHQQRQDILDKLGTIGQVRIGEIIHESGECFFVRTINSHAERSKATHQFSIPLTDPISPGRYYAALNAEKTAVLGLTKLKPSTKGKRLSLEEATEKLAVGEASTVVLGWVNQSAPDRYAFSWGREPMAETGD